MSYRNPRIMFEHAFRDAGAAAVTTDEAADAARLIDSLISRPFIFDASGTDHWVAVDLGAAPPTGYHRLIIPSGHTLDGADWVLEEDSADNFPSATTLGSGTFAAGYIDEDVTPSSERYVRLRISTEGQWSFTELWLTITRSTTRGPEPDWSDTPVTQVTVTKMRSGEGYGNVIGERLRQVRFNYRKLPPADRDMFESMLDVTRDASLPFWLDRADDSRPTLLVRLDAQLDLRQDAAAPRAQGEKFRATLSATEEIA